MGRQLVWFRDDLRVADNPALLAAMHAGETVALFVVAAAQWRAHGIGANRIAFLLRCLEALARDLRALRVPLKIRDVPWFAETETCVDALMADVDAHTLHFNAQYPLDEQRRDRCVIERIERSGRVVRVHHGQVLAPPGSIVSANATPYVVFTPFNRRLRERLSPDELEPTPAPRAQPPCGVAADPVPRTIGSVSAERLADLWPGGSAEAEARLLRFVDERAATYASDRDRPDLDATSRLSAYLAVGAISVRACFAQSRRAPDAVAWQDELIWREFYQHVVAVFPHVSRGAAFRREYDGIAWRDDPEGFAAWRDGRTGYPLVDAGMRQLAATGWMHNRLRMVTAMFLSKHLLIDWRAGERHFMDLLVDGEFAANNGGWQWSASTGTDAAPYFRIFNPVAQAKKCDPDGTFVRRWIPELAALEGDALFEPWRSALDVAEYPPRVVEHGFARDRAIAAFRSV